MERYREAGDEALVEAQPRSEKVWNRILLNKVPGLFRIRFRVYFIPTLPLHRVTLIRWPMSSIRRVASRAGNAWSRGSPNRCSQRFR